MSLGLPGDMGIDATACAIALTPSNWSATQVEEMRHVTAKGDVCRRKTTTNAGTAAVRKRPPFCGAQSKLALLSSLRVQSSTTVIYFFARG